MDTVAKIRIRTSKSEYGCLTSKGVIQEKKARAGTSTESALTITTTTTTTTIPPPAALHFLPLTNIHLVPVGCLEAAKKTQVTPLEQALHLLPHHERGHTPKIPQQVLTPSLRSASPPGISTTSCPCLPRLVRLRVMVRTFSLPWAFPTTMGPIHTQKVTRQTLMATV